MGGFLTARLNDPSQAAPRALRRSVDRSWRAIEIALAGESLTTRLDRAEDRGFRDQVRAFLDAVAAETPGHDADFRRRSLADLRAARREGVLTAGQPNEQTARAAATFAHYAEPAQALHAEWEVIDRLGEQVHRAGYVDLARLVRLRVADGTCLLALAVRFFFRQETVADPRLFQGVTADRIDRLGQHLETALAGLHTLLEQQGQRLESLLESVQAVVVETHGAVLDVQAELRRQGDESRRQLQELYQAVMALQTRLDMAGRELRPRDTLSIRNDGERQAVKQVVAQYRAVPADQRAHMPALLNAIGKLEVAAGDLNAAQQDFHTLSRLVGDDAARGEAHFNAYLAALEQGQHDEALTQLQQAMECDGARFALFATQKYEPLRILGAGGFGVTFHCRYRATGGDVAVKVLTPEGLERDVSTVFQEAGALDSIQHPAIIRLRECDFADAARTRPYLVMEYFDGMTVEEFVRTKGPMSVRLFLVVFMPVAEALEAAHQRKVLHRDVKPANLLVRPGGASSKSWQVKLIDFGLALKQSVLAEAGSTARSGKTILGSSIAGTIDYAAPEQMGKVPGARIGPAADVYGFGRTACFALFGTPHPLRAHWRQVPDALADLLDACLHEDPRQRLGDFGQVVQRLKAFARSEARPAEPPVAEVVPEAAIAEALPVEEPVRAHWRQPESRRVERRPDVQRLKAFARSEARPAEPPVAEVVPEAAIAEALPVEEPVRAHWRHPRQRPRSWLQGGMRLPYLVSAVLGVLYLSAAFGIGYGLDEMPRSSSKKAVDVTMKKAFPPRGHAEEAKEVPSRERHLTTTFLGALCIGAVIGAPCGLVIRSLRGWLFVLVVSMGLGLLMAVVPTSTPMTAGGPVGDFFAGTAVGALLAWAIAVPLKGVLWLVRTASAS